MTTQARVYCLLARAARRAVVFRRGPTKRVALLTWDLTTDAVVEGQWLKGRIYERRCDLSPDGQLLLYFAATYRQPYRSWSAISRPPYLTALALWPKGNGWGGGGQFAAADRVRLNHRKGEMRLAAGHALPPGLTIEQLSEMAGWGEDDPVWSMRLERDGWVCTSGRSRQIEDRDGKVWITLEPPIIWEKAHPVEPGTGVLRMLLRGIHERNGAWYVIDHTLVTGSGETLLEGTDWADWDHSGDLLYAAGASLYRRRYTNGAIGSPILVADLSDMQFKNVAPPDECRHWPAAPSR